jgi:hypothetical protein
MKILIVDGPGTHPLTYATSLGGALHRLGHGVIVHPHKDVRDSWPSRHSLNRHARKVLEVHQPDVVHVISRAAWFAKAFSGRGIPIVHSAEDRAWTADWVVAPSRVALDRIAGSGEGVDLRVGRLPYAIDRSPLPESYGAYALASVPAGDAVAAKWVEEAAWSLPFLPLRTEGDPREARFVIALSSGSEPWPGGVAEAMAAGRPVIAHWGGAASEFVLEGVTGFLSASGDVASLRAQMEYLWDHPEEARRMGAEASKHAKEHFDPEVHAKALIRWYLRAGVSRLAV